MEEAVTATVEFKDTGRLGGGQRFGSDSDSSVSVSCVNCCSILESNNKGHGFLDTFTIDDGHQMTVLDMLKWVFPGSWDIPTNYIVCDKCVTFLWDSLRSKRLFRSSCQVWSPIYSFIDAEGELTLAVNSSATSVQCSSNNNDEDNVTWEDDMCDDGDDVKPNVSVIEVPTSSYVPVPVSPSGIPLKNEGPRNVKVVKVVLKRLNLNNVDLPDKEIEKVKRQLADVNSQNEVNRLRRRMQKQKPRKLTSSGSKSKGVKEEEKEMQIQTTTSENTEIEAIRLEVKKRPRPRNRRHGCNDCGKLFRSHRDLKDHRMSVHNDPPRPYHCDRCEKTFRTEQILNTHVKQTHELFRRFICELCGLGNTSMGHLRKHKERIHGPDSLQCPECPEKFNNRRMWKNHIKLHKKPNEGNHPCPKCPKRFLTPSHLRTHLRSHDVQGTFPCPLCSRLFKHVRNVFSHLNNVHYGDEGQKAADELRIKLNRNIKGCQSVSKKKIREREQRLALQQQQKTSDADNPASIQDNPKDPSESDPQIHVHV